MKIAHVVATAGIECIARDIERVAGYLSKQLVVDGHVVTLLTCRPITQSVPFESRAARQCPLPIPDSLDLLVAHHDSFDVIHLHGDIRRLSALRDIDTPIVATMYCYPTAAMLAARASLPDAALIAVTEHQRTLFRGLRWHATIAHGLPERVHPFRIDADNYLAYVGSLKSVIGVRRAVEVALRSGLPLKIADRIVGRELRQLEQQLKPLISQGASVEFVGELEPARLGEFLGEARALLFTNEWSDPLPLVMLDALACGTPVIAWRSGASEYVVRDGETGFVIASIDEAVRAITRLREINRLSCRRAFDERFSVKRMAHEYACLYEQFQQSSLGRSLDRNADFGGCTDLGQDRAP